MIKNRTDLTGGLNMVANSGNVTFKSIWIFSSFIASIVCLLSPAQVVAETAKETVQSTLDSLVSVVAQYKDESQLAERRAKMREVITPKFDFDEMAMRSLGNHWKSINDTERQEFVSVFSELLAKTYLNKIENLESDTVSVNSEKQVSNKALVKTVVQYKGDTFPLDYKLLNRGGSWKVYDVVIENIGLVSNYRNEFAGIIRKKDFAGLISDLKAKVAE